MGGGEDAWTRTRTMGLPMCCRKPHTQLVKFVAVFEGDAQAQDFSDGPPREPLKAALQGSWFVAKPVKPTRV